MMKKLVAALALIAFAAPVPTLAEEEGLGEYASQVAQGSAMNIPPGIYAHTARTLSDFFAATNGARTIYAQDLKARIDAGVPQLILDTRAPADFAKGHVPGAVNIPLAGLFLPENLAL